MEQEVNFQDFKARCSAISKVLSESNGSRSLTEKQAARLSELESKEKLSDSMKAELAELLLKKDNSTKIVLSDTCIDYLMEVYAWKTQRMISVSKESLDLMQMKKGKLAEGESIKLISLVEGEIFEKNTEQVFNDYLTGEPDMFAGESIYKATMIDDSKTIWDYPTFLRAIHKPLEKGYTNQVQGYCDITGASVGKVTKVLVSTPEEIVEEMKWKVVKKFGAATMESPEFIREWEKWEHSMNFDHIPIHQRVFSQKVDPFTDFERQKVYDKVKICRDWLCSFHEMYQNINLAE